MDSLLYREIKYNQDQIDMQRDLLAQMECGCTWGMKFNTKMCNIMQVTAVLTNDQVIVSTARRSTLKMAANLTQILNFKANFHKEFELF